MFQDSMLRPSFVGQSISDLVASNSGMSWTPVNGDDQVRELFQSSGDVTDENEGESLGRVEAGIGYVLKGGGRVGEDIDLFARGGRGGY